MQNLTLGASPESGSAGLLATEMAAEVVSSAVVVAVGLSWTCGGVLHVPAFSVMTTRPLAPAPPACLPPPGMLSAPAPPPPGTLPAAPSTFRDGSAPSAPAPPPPIAAPPVGPDAG